LPLPPASDELKLAWSRWRRAKRQQARRSHYRRRTLFQNASDVNSSTKEAM